MIPQSRVDEARDWLRIAAEDLRLPELGLAASPPIVGLALYHAQQAAEKALKSFLVLHAQQYPLTHNLRELLRLALPFDASLEEEILTALDLTIFATRYRYPGDPVEPDVQQGRHYLALGRAACEARIPPSIPTPG